jgi:hypothetical protein
MMVVDEFPSSHCNSSPCAASFGSVIIKVHGPISHKRGTVREPVPGGDRIGAARVSGRTHAVVPFVRR